MPRPDRRISGQGATWPRQNTGRSASAAIAVGIAPQDVAGGDPRLAILALLHDIDALARDFENSVSRGFVRHEKVVWLKTISGSKLRA